MIMSKVNMFKWLRVISRERDNSMSSMEFCWMIERMTFGIKGIFCDLIKVRQAIF